MNQKGFIHIIFIILGIIFALIVIGYFVTPQNTNVGFSFPQNNINLNNFLI